MYECKITFPLPFCLIDVFKLIDSAEHQIRHLHSVLQLLKFTYE